MNEKPKENSHITGWVVALVVVPVIYVLSVGPMLFLSIKYDRKLLSKPTVEAFYEPLDWLLKNNSMRKAMIVYEEWWMRLAYKE